MMNVLSIGIASEFIAAHSCRKSEVGEVGDAAEFEFGHDLHAVFLHRFDGDRLDVGHGFIGLAQGDEPKDFEFAFGEWFTEQWIMRLALMIALVDLDDSGHGLNSALMTAKAS
jgi:hypothetical protein